MTTHDVASESTWLDELARLRGQCPARDPRLVSALHRLARFYFDLHRYTDVRPLLEESLDIRVAALGENHFLTAECLAHLASLEATCLDLVKAIDLLRRAQRILERWLPQRRAQLAVVLNQLGEVLYADAQYSEALSLCRRALELQGGDIQTATPEVTRTRNNLAALHVARGEYYLAARLLKLNVQIMKCDGRASELTIATALNNLAEVFRLQGLLAESWRPAVKALYLRRRVLGRQHSLAAQSWSNLAAIRFDAGRYTAAESLIRRALAVRQVHSATHPGLLAATLRSLADVVLARGRAYEAEQIYRQAVEIYEQAFGPRDADLALTLTYLGKLHIDCGQHGSAQQALARAVSIQESRSNVRDPEIAFTFNTFGSLHAARGNFEQAEIFYRRALERQRVVLGPDHPEVATTLLLVGDAAFARGDISAAESSCRKALAIRRRQLGERHKSVPEAMHRLAKFLVADGEPERAIELCLAIRKRHHHTLGISPTLHADTLGTLADAHFAQEHLDHVETLSREELQLREPSQTARPGESLPALARLTRLHLRRRQHDQALQTVEQLMVFAERLHGANHPNMIPFVEQLADVRIARGDTELAEAAVERTLKLSERKHGAASAKVVELLERFGNLFHESGRVELSDAYFNRASNFRDRNSHALFV